MKGANREYLVFRLSALAWLTGWFFKYGYFYPYLLHTTQVYPVTAAQFPAFFENPGVAAVVYHLPLLAAAGLFFQRRAVFIATGCLFLLCAGILGLHIDTYNDMTFVSSFWVAVWLIWYAVHIDKPDHIAEHAPFLAKCIVGLLFLGGTVGKLTPEYWSGEVFYNTVVRQTPGFFGMFVAKTFSVDQQRLIMSIISKGIIIVEALLVLSPLYPYRFYAAFASFSIVMLVVFRHWQILSVLSCLAGITLACLLLLRDRPRTETNPQTR